MRSQSQPMCPALRHQSAGIWVTSKFLILNCLFLHWLSPSDLKLSTKLECTYCTPHVSFRQQKNMHLSHRLQENCGIILAEVRKLGSVYNAYQTFLLTPPSAPSAHKTSVPDHGPCAREITGEMNNYSRDSQNKNKANQQQFTYLTITYVFSNASNHIHYKFPM